MILHNARSGRHFNQLSGLSTCPAAEQTVYNHIKAQNSTENADVCCWKPPDTTAVTSVAAGKPMRASWCEHHPCFGT